MEEQGELLHAYMCLCDAEFGGIRVVCRRFMCYSTDALKSQTYWENHPGKVFRSWIELEVTNNGSLVTSWYITLLHHCHLHSSSSHDFGLGFSFGGPNCGRNCVARCDLLASLVAPRLGQRERRGGTLTVVCVRHLAASDEWEACSPIHEPQSCRRQAYSLFKPGPLEWVVSIEECCIRLLFLSFFDSTMMRLQTKENGNNLRLKRQMDKQALVALKSTSMALDPTRGMPIHTCSYDG